MLSHSPLDEARITSAPRIPRTEITRLPVRRGTQQQHFDNILTDYLCQIKNSENIIIVPISHNTVNVIKEDIRLKKLPLKINPDLITSKMKLNDNFKTNIIIN